MNSSEHGDGLVRAEFSRRLFGDDLYEAMRELKRAFDPDNRLNPGKKVDSPSMTDSLREPTFRVRYPLTTAFTFQQDDGMRGAANRCVRVGACRKSAAAGTMCPSFMATRDERHSTRGRANALVDALSSPDPRAALGRRRVDGGPGPLPRVQGVQVRVSDVGGHGHAQVRGALPSLCAARHAAVGAFLRQRAARESTRVATWRRWRMRSEPSRASCGRWWNERPESIAGARCPSSSASRSASGSGVALPPRQASVVMSSSSVIRSPATPSRASESRRSSCSNVLGLECPPR